MTRSNRSEETALEAPVTESPQRYGMTVPFPGPLHAQRGEFERLVQLGYTDAWSAEAMGVDGLTPLALASVWTPT